MYILMDIMVSPSGAGVSVSPYVTQCQQILEESGLTHTMHGYGTNVEGEWDDVMAVVKRFHEEIHAAGAVRIISHLKLGTRTDRMQTMADKVTSVQDKLAAE